METDRAVPVTHVVDLPAHAVDAAFALWIEVGGLQIFGGLRIAALALRPLRMILDGELARTPQRHIEGMEIAARVINDRSAIARWVADVEMLLGGLKP